MKDSAKIGAAVVGGYLLGRTKKGKTAIGLALWLSGNRMGNPRAAFASLASSPEVAKLAAQVRGPLLAAAQRAVTATIESRTTSLADSLHQRTSNLLEVAGTRDKAPVDVPEKPDVRHRRDDDLDDIDQVDEIDDDGADEEPPRQAKRPAKAVRRSRAERSSDETREPARSRETARSREPGRSREPARRRTPRGGEAS